MVENFNKRIKRNLLTKYRFQSIFELNDNLLEFIDGYIHTKRLKKLNYLSACYLSACNAQADAQAGKTPAQYLKETKGITLQRIVS